MFSILPLIALGMKSYNNTENTFIEIVDNVCFALYLLEAAVRVGADGFAGYWKNKWNKLDFGR